LNVSLLLSWRDGVLAVPAEDGGVCVEDASEGTRMILRPVPAVAQALLQLSPPGDDEDRLADLVLAAGPEALAAWYYVLQIVAGRGLVCRSVWASGRRLATLQSTSPSFTVPGAPVSPARRYLLSRFAYVRREGNVLVLESPLADARVVIHDSRVTALVSALASPLTAQDLVSRVCDLPVEAISLLLVLLAAAGMFDDSDSTEEGSGRVFCSRDAWEFHDLLFHARSRRGRCHAPSGATYRLASRMELPPAVKPAPVGELYRLFRPELEKLQAEDPSLSWAMRRRRSIREYGTRPLSAHQLGEFLYRVARIQDEQEVVVHAPQGLIPMAIATRPYPSGGALYELEFYAVIAACDGLERGLYYYEPRDHGLIRIHGLSAELGELVRDAADSAGMPEDTVQVLLVLAARFPRISWKYASIAYALILKHVGVVYQTMYMAATAMGLAPCALGCGDSDAFARAAGTDYYDETSVGEFLLGSLRDPNGHEVMRLDCRVPECPPDGNYGRI
jgi:oxazoline/thiazoline dehydrogenase